MLHSSERMTGGWAKRAGSSLVGSQEGRPNAGERFIKRMVHDVHVSYGRHMAGVGRGCFA